jgi:Family of unknown function (DUF6364)
MVGKTKLTLSINEKVRNDVQAVVDERNLTLSRLVENFLKFIIKPNIWCFKCGEKFCIQDVDKCPKCSYLICSLCSACRCMLSDETAVAVFHTNKIYQQLLGGYWQ